MSLECPVSFFLIECALFIKKLTRSQFLSVYHFTFFIFYPEPRGGSQDDFEPVLKGYYDSIRQGVGPPFQKNKRGKNITPNSVKKERVKKDGAAFMAVCRGKVCYAVIIFSERNGCTHLKM